MTWEQILPFVEKPSRYIGTEINVIKNDRRACRFSVALAFPDSYEVGMSHLGLQILYAILNSRPDIIAERCYAPWPDMEHQMRKRGLHLASLESHTPLYAFDMIGFSLQYELSYTNVLNMLEMGGIPRRSAERTGEHPLVIAGGPCTFNPAPMSAFMDAFVIGEGEEVILEIADTVIKEKARRGSRKQVMETLAAIEGVYVPSVHTHGESIRKRVITDLNSWQYPENPVVPLMKTIHDRVTLEIARGCTRGCRFCQAGMVWRPVRERNPETLQRMADHMLCSTGYDELSLLSLSSGDYSLIEPLLSRLMERYYQKRIAIGLPSLRAETLKERLIEEIKRVRKTSFTLAPEAGTQRLRDAINKGNREEDLLATTGRVFDAGWKSVKLYFMLGLPGERQEDLEGIVDLSYKVLKTARHRGQVTVSMSTFVPKAFTPYQWHAQITPEETKQRQDFFKKHLQNRNLNVKWHDARMSFLEGIFARGDERTGLLFEEAYLRGCRFDGWTDRFRHDLWEDVVRESGIPVDTWLQPRRTADNLPWSRIDCGIDHHFLLTELEKSTAGEATIDCRYGECSQCGVCDHINIRPITAVSSAAGDTADTSPVASGSGEGQPAPVGRFIIQFAKTGFSRFLSHLELSAALIRAINQSGLAFAFSQGFHPHPKISFACATSVGMASEGEYAEIQIQKPSGKPEQIMESINRFLPAGIEVKTLKEIPSYHRSLSETVIGFAYQAFLPDSYPGLETIEEKIATFMNREDYLIVRESKGKTTSKNIRPLVDKLTREDRTVLTMVVKFGPEGSVKPTDILTQVLGLDQELVKTILIVKVGTLFRG
jgi:radical SAM-linked protein